VFTEIKIGRKEAKAFAAVIISACHEYAKANPAEFQQFVSEERGHSNVTKRRSRKAKKSIKILAKSPPKSD
jgi:hypothetical protein